MNFQEKVFKVVQKIPKGKISTYKEIAKAINKPRAYRAVGNVLNKNKSKFIPCHRIIKSNGSLGGFNKGQKEKIKKLTKEGIKIEKGKINLEKYLFKF